ncbi:hypothetical protein E4T47_07749 [Aureobasidium subglaciale]|nr:hypothetical protein E4T47_07749 [Aureobasidium subglaciale]
MFIRLRAYSTESRKTAVGKHEQALDRQTLDGELTKLSLWELLWYWENIVPVYAYMRRCDST